MNLDHISRRLAAVEKAREAGFTCGNCRFARPFDQTHGPATLECRRRAPTLTDWVQHRGGPDGEGLWPPVIATAWCGEHELKFGDA